MNHIIKLALISATILLFTGCQLGEKEPTKNFGIANVEINVVDKNGKVVNDSTSPDDVVPTAQDLTDSLTKAKYDITNYSDVTDSAIAAERIYAKNGNSFIDICYSLTEEDTQAVFNYYEETYSKYYILAINGNYVYCIGDKKAFDKAGFTSKFNVGTQYIYE